MTNEKKPIKQALKNHYSARSLSEEQLDSLQTLQKKAHQQQAIFRWFSLTTLQWPGAIAASLLLIIVVFGYLQTPAIITAAYIDIKKDVDNNNGMPASMKQWMDKNSIDAVPEKYRVEMSKFCTLEHYQTTHIRVAGAEQGKLHLFFHHGDRPQHWLNRTGTHDEMNWRLIKIAKDLTLIVMYTHDMREEAVQHILGEMLPELQA